MSTWKPSRSVAESNKILADHPASPWATEPKRIGKRNVRVYKKLWPSIRQFWLTTKVFGSADYIVYKDERVTYEQAHERVAAFASLFTSRGIKKGSHIGICMRNLPEFILAQFAAHCLGSVVVAVNAWLPLDAMAHCIKKAEVDLCIVDEERSNILEPIVEDLRRAGCKTFLVARMANPAPGFERLEPLLVEHRGASLPDVNVQPEDHATIFFTSGTTSMPKGVLATQRQVLTNILNSTLSNARAALRRGDSWPTPQKNAVQRAFLITVPLFHVTGNASYLLLATLSGGKAVLVHKWDTNEVIRLIQQEKITTAGGVPFMAMEIIQGLSKEGVKHNLESMSFGGAPAPETLTAAYDKSIKGKGVSQAWGLTETNAVAVGHCAEDYLARPTSTGLATLVNDIEIRDVETQRKLPAGEVGEIFVHGANVSEGYYKDSEASKAFAEDGWFQTGDVGRLDDEGFLYITDRAKDMIIRGGENISSVSVENALYADKRVKQVAVVPVPDPQMGEVVAAVVVLHQGSEKATEQELIKEASTRLPKFSVPVIIEIVGELPRNGAGKVLKRDLKDIMKEKWQARQPKAKL